MSIVRTVRTAIAFIPVCTPRGNKSAHIDDSVFLGAHCHAIGKTEMDSELARAYNNLADPHKPTCKEMLKKALALLSPMRNTSRTTITGTSAWDPSSGISASTF